MGAPGVRHRQRCATAGAGLWVVMMDLFDWQLLHTPVSRGAWALSCPALLRRLIELRLTALASFRRLLRLFVPSPRLLSLAIGLLGLLGLVRPITIIPAIPWRPAARWT